MQQYLLQNANILLDDKMTERFETYYRFLVSENEKYNLTAITEHDEVWCKHFADSMLGSKFVPHGAALVDSLTKRVNFCTELCGKVGVSANVVHARAEDFAKDNRQRFDVAVARAVAPLNILLEYLAPLVRVGGSVVAYKTDESEVVLAKNAANILGLTFVSANRFVLPDGSNRCLLLYKKVKNTPLVYPRGQNKPRKCPL